MNNKNSGGDGTYDGHQGGGGERLQAAVGCRMVAMGDDVGGWWSSDGLFTPGFCFHLTGVMIWG